jgi:uncharacterized membrane protein YeaQ/YmgE (transglycosylase-associated protein family)
MGIASLLTWLALGAVAGWLAGKIMRGGGFGLVNNIIIGVVGSFVGGWLAGLLGLGGRAGGFNLMSIATAVAGAVLLLFVVGVIKRR